MNLKSIYGLIGLIGGIIGLSLCLFDHALTHVNYHDCIQLKFVIEIYNCYLCIKNEVRKIMLISDGSVTEVKIIL